MFDIGSEYVDRYACAERGDHLPIAHALRLPEPTKKNKSTGCVPTLLSGPLAGRRFGSTRKERKRKKEKEERTRLL